MKYYWIVSTIEIKTQATKNTWCAYKAPHTRANNLRKLGVCTNASTYT